MSFLKSHHLRWLGHARTALTTLSLAMGLSQAPAIAAAEANELSVANFTPYNDVPAFVRERLSADIQALVHEKRLTVFVLAEAYPGRNACVAVVGLSHEAPKGLNPRIPAFKSFAHAFDSAATDWKASSCVGSRLQSAIENLNNSTREAVLKDLELTAEGGSKVDEPAQKGTVQLTSFNLTKAAKGAVADVMLSHRVGALFDYRQVQTSVFATSMTFENGTIMCTVHAGMGARAPGDRNMRWPASTLSMVRLQADGTSESCIERLAPQTVDELLKQPWSAKGILKDFARTREAGVPLPDLKAVAANKRADVLRQQVQAERRQTTTVAENVSRNVLTCKNFCENGSCVRVFPDGRKERWQAPRVLNPMTQNWEWDTTTNACGG